MNKKLLLSLGTIASIATPIVTVVACGSKDKKINTKIGSSELQLVEAALNKLTFNDIATGAGASSILKSDLSTLETGDLKHFNISAKITTMAVDGTKNSPTGTDGEITITATPKKGYILSGKEGSLTTTITISKLTYANVIDAQIEKIIANPPLPTIKIGSESKTAKDVLPEDFIAPSPQGLSTIKFTISTDRTLVGKSTHTTDGTVATVRVLVTSSVDGTSKNKYYDAEVSGFTSEADKHAEIQRIAEDAKIDEVISNPIAPTIKSGSNGKTANELTPNDFIAPPNRGTLSFTIKSVVPSTSTSDGTKAIVTIHVSSSVQGTKENGDYTIEVSGFKSNYEQNWIHYLNDPSNGFSDDFKTKARKLQIW